MSLLRASVARLTRSPHAGHDRNTAATARLTLLIRTLTGRAPASRDLRSLTAEATRVLGRAGHEEIWLTLAVLRAQLPEHSEVVRLRRLAELDGAAALVPAVLDQMPRGGWHLNVEVATSQVLLDVNHLAQTTLLTGIQRVTHETVRRWHRDHDVTFLRWDEDFRSLRRTDAPETARVISGPQAHLRGEGDEPAAPPAAEDTTVPGVVVPWRAQFVLPEVALEVSRTKRLQSLALHARCTTAVIGFDTVPLTSGETTDTNVPAYFMHELAAIRHMDRVAAISGAAATEYEGWRTMTSSLGVAGPQVRAISLPAQGAEPTAEALAAARDRYLVPGMPLVLCVGSTSRGRTTWRCCTRRSCCGAEGTGSRWCSSAGTPGTANVSACGSPGSRRRGGRSRLRWGSPMTCCGRCTGWPAAPCSRPSTRASGYRWLSRWPSVPR